MRESYRNAACRAFALALVMGAAGVASGEGGVTGYKQGKGGTPVSGAAGTGGSSGDSVQHCDKPMGALAVVEPQDYVMQSLNRYGLQSPTSLIRMMVQQSNCFIVVERGVGMQNVMQERELAASGAAAPGLEHGRRADGDARTSFSRPTSFSQEDNAGGIGGALGGVLSRKNPLLGAVAGGLKFKEAQTSMLLADARSGVQVAAAEGSTRKADLALGGALFGGYGGGAVGGYGNTNEGQDHRGGAARQLQQGGGGGARAIRACSGTWARSRKKRRRRPPPARCSTKATSSCRRLRT